MTFVIIFIFFALGLVIGSFLNVVVLRFNTERSFGGRSGCMTCHHKLSWKELFPILSFLWLKGRCKNCRSKISSQYPVVEFLTGLIFAFLFIKFQDSFYLSSFSFPISYAYYATIFSILMVIAVYDFKHKIIPDLFSIFLGALSFVGMFLFENGWLVLHVPSLLDILSGFLLALPFALFWLVSKGRWMGLGDAKLALGLGWLLGYPMIVSGMSVSFWSGAVVSVCLLVFSKSKKFGMKSEIPFAPFLIFGASVVFFLGLDFFPFLFVQ